MFTLIRPMGATSIAVLFLSCGQASPPPAEPGAIPAIVDDYLDRFARRHPSIAAGNGLHAHDAGLEDFSARAIREEVEWLHAVRDRLEAVDPDPLTPDDRVDRRILLGVIDGWLLDLDTVRTWTRNRAQVRCAHLRDPIRPR